MIYDKKPSVYSDRGTIGSAEELDAYGVWVKSEPQDMVAGLAGTVDYESGVMPYESDYDAGFSIPESESMSADIGDFEGSSLDESDFSDDSFPNDSYADSEPINNGFSSSGFEDVPGRGTDEVSTQLLMKIADELKSIRSELTTLKNEFADIRAETGIIAKDETRHSDFFEEDGDEKITLTGDELDNILSSANLSTEEELVFDPLRDEDEAALSEISDQNEASEETTLDMAGDDEGEEIEIDFDNLGIDLNYTEEPDASEEASPPEDSVTEEPLFSVSEMEEITELSEEAEVQELSEEIAAIESSDDADELRSLRIEGAAPLTPPPDDSDYLEADPFPLSDTGLDELSSGENSLELSLDDAGFNLDMDDFTEEMTDEVQALEEDSLEVSPLDETILEEATLDEESLDEESLDETSLEEASLEEVSLDEASLEEPTLETLSLDDTMDETLDEATLESFSLEESPLDGASLDPLDESSSEELTLETVSLEEEPLEETTLETVSFEEETPEEVSMETMSLEEEPLEEISFDDSSMETIALEEAPLEETSLEADSAEEQSIDLSEAVIDEPDLSVEITETPLEEPSLGDISLEMDDFDLSDDFNVKDDELSVDNFDSDASMNIVSDADESLNGELTLNGVDVKSIDFALDDFGESFDPDIKDDDSEVAAYNEEKDDSIAQVIPEGFEVNAEEAAVSFDDDIEAFSEDELPIVGEDINKQEFSVKADDGPTRENINIPAGLKTELKNVLSYMDHLLESLPEEKIEEFAKSEYFESYKKLFKDLGLA